MRLLKKNKQDLHYALFKGELPEYVLDSYGNKKISYVDDDGNNVYEETGQVVLSYETPVPFSGNISTTGNGEAIVKPFGIDISGYDAILVMEIGALPLEETSLLWHNTLPRFKDEQKTVVDKDSADYTIAKIKNSLNQVVYLLKQRVK